MENRGVYIVEAVGIRRDYYANYGGDIRLLYMMNGNDRYVNFTDRRLQEIMQKEHELQGFDWLN